MKSSRRPATEWAGDRSVALTRPSVPSADVMYELHQHEQYFFDAPTLDHLAGFIAARWRAPCCLCLTGAWQSRAST